MSSDKPIKPISTSPKLDKMIESSQKAMNALDVCQQMLASAADGLATKYASDPYIRGALHGIMPPKRFPEVGS